MSLYISACLHVCMPACLSVRLLPACRVVAWLSNMVVDGGDGVGVSGGEGFSGAASPVVDGERGDSLRDIHVVSSFNFN